MLGDGIEQGDRLQRVPRRAEAADVADPAAGDRLLDGGDEQIDFELLDGAVAELDDLLEVVAGVDVHHGERDARREERPLGEVEHHDGVLAPGEQQDGALALGGDLADDRDRFVLEAGRGDRRRRPSAATLAQISHNSDRSSRISPPEARSRTIGAMPGTLVTLRHGQSTWNLENLFTGWHDVPLTEQGEAEAAAAGQGDGATPGCASTRRTPRCSCAPWPRRTSPSREMGLEWLPGAAPLAAQRAALRRPAGSRQEADRRAPRRRADPPVAAQLRRPAAAGRPEQPRAPGQRLALPLADPRGAARQRVPRRRRRPRAARTGRTSSPRSCSPASTCSSPPTATHCGRC